MSVVFASDRPLHTAGDLERLSSQEHRYELIRGELRPMAPAGIEHGYVSGVLSSFLTVFVFQNDLGRCFTAETGFWIAHNPDTVLAPDWAFVAKHRLLELSPVGFGRIVPDAVIETRSPGDTTREVAAKVRRWTRAGVQIVWEIDPKRQIVSVHRAGTGIQELSATDTLTGEDVIPGFRIPLNLIFW